MHFNYAIIIFAALAEPSAAPRAAPSRAANGFICGPRCVQRVLQHYGQKVELIDLVRELQGAAIDRPANLADIKQALERRGIKTAGVKIRPSDVRWIDWPYPVIAHLKGRETQTGHFCVLLPFERGVASERIPIWDGLSGASMRSAAEVTAQASGAVLLTSVAVIPQKVSCLSLWRLGCSFGASAAALMGSALILKRCLVPRAGRPARIS